MVQLGLSGKHTGSPDWLIGWILKANYHRAGVSNIFTRGHISLEVAFKEPNVTLGLYKCNYSLIVKQELGATTG